MKINIIPFILLLNIKICYTQNIVILDSITKETIPYAAIQNHNTNIGVYTNEKGLFSIADLKSDSIKISHIGYKPLKLKKSEIKDTIFLKQNLDVLNEIVIITGKSKEKTIGYIKKRKDLSWYIKEKTELATLIKYEKNYKKAYIKKIFIPIGKKTFEKQKNKWERISPKFNSIFRVHIYTNTNNRPDKRLLNSPIIINCDEKFENIITINVSNQFIEFPKNGVFIGIEMMGQLDENNKIINDSKTSIFPSFEFTSRKNKDISSISYIKNIFSKGSWRNTNKYNKLKEAFSKYNMAISLELSIYE